MRTEVVVARINPDSRQNTLRRPSSVTHNFSGPEWVRMERDKIIPVAGLSSVVLLDIPTQKIVDNAEFPKLTPAEMTPIEKVEKSLAYNPGRRKKDYLDDTGRRIIRRRRASRCNGVHDAEADPCGSPRCRTKGRQDLKTKGAGNNQQRRRRRQKVILNPRKSTS
jgi:hypothetical protein